jgi:hypothetical protein
MRADKFSEPYDPKDHMPYAAPIQEGIQCLVGATCGEAVYRKI